MDDFISKTALLSKFNTKCFTATERYLALIEAPVVSFERNGHWIPNTDDFTPHIRCSACGYNKPILAGQGIRQEPVDYCNKCGTKMDRR